ncbi:MAG: hypothetical protein OXI64_09485 [Defluviicoccus sp.]|nr:hypothetical protein [Defluviicoccus sp.]
MNRSDRLPTGKETPLKYTMLILMAATLLGCNQPAVIADIETDKVVVQKLLFTSDEDVMQKAREGCALHGRVPRPISKRASGHPASGEYWLFACIDKTQQ